MIHFSKLTRILKDGLSGNSQTIMIATISPAGNQYHHTVNTLKYAYRAKEIKTHIQKNIGTINPHISDYQKMIDNLQHEVSQLRQELADKESQLSAKSTEKTVDDEISWLNKLSQETSENVQERINLQKAMIELEETNLHNRKELRHLDDAIAKQQVVENAEAVVQALQARRQMILDNIRDNDELGVTYQKEIEANEMCRCQLQDMIDEAIRHNGNKTYLGILSQYKLLGISNTELQFEMAIRDQIIYNQRVVQKNLWNLITSLGLDEKQIVELGAKQGLTIEDIHMSAPLSFSNISPSNLQHKSHASVYRPTFNNQPGTVSPCFPQGREFNPRPFHVENWKFPSAVLQEEHHSSYYYISHGISSSMNQQWCSNQPSSYFAAPAQQSQGFHNPFPRTGLRVAPHDENDVSSSLFSSNFRQQQQVAYAETSGTLDPYRQRVAHGGITRGIVGRLPLGQGGGNINFLNCFPIAPAPGRQSAPQLRPPHSASKFEGESF